MYRGAVAVLVLAACKFAPGTTGGGAVTGDAPIGSDAGATADAARISGLVAWYPMDAAPAAGTVQDMSGHGHDGACTDCPSVTAGRVGMGAYVFDTFERIDVMAIGELMAPTAFTVSLWGRLDHDNGQFNCMVNKGFGPAGANSWQLCLSNSRTPYYGTAYTTGSDELDGTTAAAVGIWHHYAISWDGTSKQLWVDGAMAGPAHDTAISYDMRPITIGADIDNPVGMISAAGFAGAIDEVRIYNRALAADEIAVLAAGGS